MNKNFRDLLNERLKDEDFKKEYNKSANHNTDVAFGQYARDHKCVSSVKVESDTKQSSCCSSNPNWSKEDEEKYRQKYEDGYKEYVADGGKFSFRMYVNWKESVDETSKELYEIDITKQLGKKKTFKEKILRLFSKIKNLPKKEKLEKLTVELIKATIEQAEKDGKKIEKINNYSAVKKIEFTDLWTVKAIVNNKLISVEKCYVYINTKTGELILGNYSSLEDAEETIKKDIAAFMNLA